MRICRRILHVVERMEPAGTETWLMHILRRIDRTAFRMDFAVLNGRPGHYDTEIRDLGSQIIPCLDHRAPLRYARNFGNALRQYGPYEVVHSHVDHYSGFALRLARYFRVPVRIAHSHNDTSLLQKRARPARRAYLRLMRNWIRTSATHCLAASRSAAAAIFGSDWESDPRCRLLYCGIDLDAFRSPADSIALRSALGLPHDACVVGHVGRFYTQKNHSFFVDVAAELVKLDPSVRFLLIGDGPLRNQIVEKLERLSLSKYFVFAGVRTDVPQLMLGAMDAFLFPSLFEGLGLALIEAQAAGLPSLTCDHLPHEANVVPDLVQRLPSSAPAARWATALRTMLSRRTVDRLASIRFVSATPFTIDASLKELEALYTRS